MKCFTQNYFFQESSWLLLHIAHQITGHTDFLWKHFAKTLTWCHIIQKIPCYCKFNDLTFYSFGWRLLLCQHETLSSKSVGFFVWKPLKYIYMYLYQEQFGWTATVSRVGFIRIMIISYAVALVQVLTV